MINPEIFSINVNQNSESLTNNRTSYTVGKTEILLISACILLLIVVKSFNIDFVLADQIYQLTNWDLKYAFWTETIMHKGARYLVIVIFLFLIYSLFEMYRNQADKQNIYDLTVVLISVVLCVASIAILKQIFDADCPWDLLRYGGDKPFFSLFEYSETSLTSKHCFPASHAGIGYSGIVFFYYLKVNNHHLKKKALLFGVILGGVFGVVQQLRGAHFISHDISSLLVCMIILTGVYKLAYRR